MIVLHNMIFLVILYKNILKLIKKSITRYILYLF